MIVRLEQGLMRMPPNIIYNNSLQVKVKRVPIQAHQFIEFKHYSGNEILFALKDCTKFQPGELSSALLQLGLRRGLPENYDWESHPYVKLALGVIKVKIPQYSCRVLTSLAHGLNRLKVKDTDVWDALALHIARTCSAIDSTGLAHTLVAFKDKNYPKIYEDLLTILPVHVAHMSSIDLIKTVKALAHLGENSEGIFQRYLYPSVEENLKSLGIAQMTELVQALEARKDFPQELKEAIQSRIEKKYSKTKVISFGGVDKKIKHKPQKKIPEEPN